MLWLVAPSVVAISTSALLAAGCAKGREDAKKGGKSSVKSDKSGKSSRKAGASSRSKSSKRGAAKPKSGVAAVGAAGGAKNKSARSKRANGSSKSSKSAGRKQQLKGVGAAGAIGAAGAAGKAGEPKSTSSKRREAKAAQMKSARAAQGDKSSKSSKSSSRSAKSNKSNRSKRATAAKPAGLIVPVDKTQESVEDKSAKAKAPVPVPAPKTVATSPAHVSVTKLELAALEGAAKQEVRIEPSELRWKSTGGIQHVNVYNHSNSRKAIKVKCSDNLLYRVNPVHTFLAAGGSARIDILRQNGTAKVDKIVLVAADARPGEANARDVLIRAPTTDMMVLPLIAVAAV